MGACAGAVTAARIEADIVRAFGDLGFRLKVGEIGVSPWDAAARLTANLESE